VVLVAVWTGAAGGVALKMFWPHGPAWVGVPFYLALGWVAVFVLPDLLDSGGWAVLILLVVGGILYSCGAIFYATRRPNTWPTTFGYHEYFHACVSLAALCHCVAIWLLLFRVS
jgi:hemolysin III